MLRNVSLFLAVSLPLITVRPDGERVTYSSFEVSDCDIYVINADGSGAVNVTSTSDADECCPSRQPL